MAAQIFVCKLDRTDRIFNPSATFPGGVRVRPGETVEVDLALPEQADNFDDDNYELSIDEDPQITPFAVL